MVITTFKSKTILKRKHIPKMNIITRANNTFEPLAVIFHAEM